MTADERTDPILQIPDLTRISSMRGAVSAHRYFARTTVVTTNIFHDAWDTHEKRVS